MQRESYEWVMGDAVITVYREVPKEHDSYKWIREQYPKTSETLVFERMCDALQAGKNYSKTLHTDEDIVKATVEMMGIDGQVRVGLKFRNPDIWISDAAPTEPYKYSYMYMALIESLIVTYQNCKRLDAS